MTTSKTSAFSSPLRLTALVGAACLAFAALQMQSSVAAEAAVKIPALSDAPASTSTAATQTAVFAGGCFWCTEADFDKVKGVVSTTSGYTGGKVPTPGYERVSAGGTGHVLEYRGSTIRATSMEERMTICNMSIEAGARAGMIAPDETTFEYLKTKPRAPQGAE